MLSPKRKCTPDQSEFYGKALLRVLNQKATARIIEQCLIILFFFGVNYLKSRVNGVDKN